MATTTFTSHADNQTTDPNVVTDPDRYAKIVKLFFQRNMKNLKLIEDANVVVPSRTITNPSPQKKTAANRHPGQTHTRGEIDGALNQELAMARFLMPDLADHVFGHIVSTELARDILQQFVETKVVQVFESSTSSCNVKNLLDPASNEARRAVKEAFRDADYYDCIRPGSESDDDSLSAGAKGNGKQKEKEKTYTYRWTKFPSEPLREDQLVDFLNEVTDFAFEFARPRLAVANPKLHHRFAVPQDKHHAVPLSYEPDGQDMRPDFLLLPIEAFSDDFKTVDEKYVNFTAARLVGESKNKDLATGVKQMQQYARGLRRAQPWIYYVLGLTVTRDKVVLLRGEGSGTERLELMMRDGRGCIEFIRILLGLALADKEDLGHNPDIVLGGKEQVCKARNVTRSVKTRAGKRKSEKAEMSSFSSLLSRRMNDPLAQSGNSEPADSRANVPSSSKRVYTEISEGYEEGRRSKKCKTEENLEEDVERFIFYPVAVYGHKCLGILFTAGSIRGRGTTVFCVVDLKDDKTLLALKIAWQDVARAMEQEAVMKHLSNNEPHPNLIVPVRTYKVEKNGEACTTLGSIRGFLDNDIGTLGVENRVLTISVSELKRPVKYFWGVHDFVRGLRGALLGHEYLTKIGILHRDISENNIVLGLRPEDERGYLIDLDMAILQDAEEPTPLEPVEPRVLFSTRSSRKSSRPLQHDDEKVVKALRTGTFPYISYNVLLGGKHTQFDDVESFLYVLLLFFFSYAGPLSPSELRKVHEEGFSHSIGSGRLLHTRNWLKEYAEWADGHPKLIAGQKHIYISRPNGATEITDSPEFVDCLANNWPHELDAPICDLIENSFWMFYNSTLRTAGKGSRTEVSYAEFIEVLDKWLELYADLEDEFSNCPFKLPTSVEARDAQSS